MGRIQTGVRVVAACVVLAVVLGVDGCYHAYIDVGDVGRETEATAEVDGAGEAVVETDAVVDDSPDGESDADAEIEVEADDETCAGGWYDRSTGFCWQDTSPIPWLRWTDATAYCSALDLGGCDPGSWHLPSIAELRSVIRGCPGTASDGPCGVGDSCTDMACWSFACAGCADSAGGPGPEWQFWPSGLGGNTGWYWSSSSCEAGSSAAWHVKFDDGYVGYTERSWPLYARCVRPGP